MSTPAYILLTDSGWEVYDNADNARYAHHQNVIRKISSVLSPISEMLMYLAPGQEMTDDWATLCEATEVSDDQD